MAQQRDGYQNFMPNQQYNMNSPNQPPQQVLPQGQPAQSNALNMQQPNQSFGSAPNVDPNFYYQQQQQQQLLQQQQRQAASPQQIQQQHLNYLRAQQQQQQQQQQMSMNNGNGAGFNNFHPARPQQQQPSPQQQVSPMLMNAAAMGNRQPNPNMMYNPMMNPQLQQQRSPQQPHQQHMRGPPQQQIPPGYGQPPRHNGFPPHQPLPQQQLNPQQQQQLNPQQLAYQQQLLQRQQMQHQMMMQQQHQQHGGFDPRMHQLHPHQQQQLMMQRMHPQQIQMQHHQYQQQLQAEQNRAKRPSRNATKKKRVYDMSSEEEEEEFDLESEESEASADSEFDDSDEGRQSKKTKAAAAAAEPEEPVMIPMGTKVFERILDYRVNEESGEKQLLIKYKNTSFLHVEWVPLKQIESEHLGKHRVKKFLQKYHQDGDKGEDFKDYLKMDRVIDDGELEDPATGESRVYYLVKWNNSFYDASTWETEEDVRLHDNNLLEQFLSRKLIPQDKQGPSPPRPDVSNFTHYSESPKYKYDNTLRAYQLEGLNWLRFCYYTFRSCILADEMGLGKTVQSVALLNDIYNNLRIRGPFLIIAPLSTIPHWTRAFDAWTDLNVIDFRGSTMARNLIVETEFHYQDAEGNSIPNKFKFDVLITTYEMASAGAMTLKDIPWRCGVFDEAHRLKNKNSKVLEILRTFYMDHKLLLTGTPLQNNLGELYSLLQFMQPDIYNDEAYFFQEYGSLKTAQEVEKLQALLQPIMLRRFKEDVEKTIPVKEETVIEVELTNPQKKWYRAILEKNFSFLKKGGKSNKEMPHLRNIMMQLRKCCIHPYLLEGAEDVIVSECNATGQQEQFNCLVQSSGKLVLIDKLLRKLIQGNHKVLIFSQFTSCLDILADYLRGRSYAYERIDGSVPGDQRQAAIDRFSTLPIEESFVFLLCTRAGGVGINLTAADTCIIFDSDWNPQNDLQAQARCHRIGQTKPVQIYRLICANTYEKDMFDRAGMKLGLDKAVMGTHDDGNANKTAELNRKEIEDLLKKGAYGAMLDDEASAKFCEEDIDQILERRTTVIKHEGNEKGSVFSKATFSAAEEGDTTGVDLDDPDFWEKWAAKAHIDTTELPDENTLIVSMPRRRRQVQRFGSRTGDGSYSSNDNADDSDAAYEEEEVEPVGRGRRGRSDQVRPWTLSEKTKYERKLMIYGYGSWDLMVAHFPRRTEKDLKAVTRALMRKVLPVLENVKKVTEEDRKLIEDIKNILVNDARDEVKKNENMPYIGANKKQIAEFKSFLIQAPADYIDHVERKGRNFLLRIQMLHLIRDKIVPEDWEEAKALEMPRVTGLPPAPWWGEKEDRCLLLGICKHGYQQYLAMRNDPEFAFYGRKYDDSHSGVLEDEDAAPDYNRQPSDEPAPIIAKKTVNKRDDDSDYEDNNDKDYSDDEDKALIWPSKADIGMRLRRIIAAFLRERANDNRKRKLEEKAEQKETDRQTRQRQKESRAAVRKNEVHTRWTKRNKMDFIKTLISFGVEREDDEFNWTRFKEVANLGKKSDNALNQRYKETYAACEEAVKRYISEGGVVSTSAGTDETPASSPRDMASREGSPEFDDNAKDDGLISYDKARRCLKRIKLMNTLREEVLPHPELDAILANFKKTPGLPEWWEVPKFDKALIEGVCKHGINRSDLLAKDTTLPFYHAQQDFAEGDQEGAEGKFVWPKDVVVIRRVESICEAVLNPKPPKSSARGYVKKRNRSTAADAAGVSDEESRKKTRTEGDDEELSDEEMDEDENEESAYADEEDEGNVPLPAANDISIIPFEAPTEAIEPVSSVANDLDQQASVQNTPLESLHVSPTPVEEPSQHVLPVAEETVMAPPSPHQEIQPVFPAENNTVEVPMETESYTAAFNDASLPPQHEALVEQPAVDNQDQTMREPVKDDDHVMES